ncbi:hypothetical protein BGZ94_000133 [Podila epigama]|nr:hypothetical protein BGZ94_000133 [Podila epigama]
MATDPLAIPAVASKPDSEDYTITTPFTYTQFGAVLMVDIVGFSQMTSIASSKGDVGAEMLASQIGTYFDLAIRIIEYHGGDVVKFLGDALLVVFQPDPDPEDNRLESPDSIIDDPAAKLKRHKMLVRRAVECGMELLGRLSNYRIYLSEREFARKTSGGTSSSDDIVPVNGNNIVENNMQPAPGQQSTGTGTRAGLEGVGTSADKSRFSMTVNGVSTNESESDFWTNVCGDPTTLSTMDSLWPSTPAPNSNLEPNASSIAINNKRPNRRIPEPDHLFALADFSDKNMGSLGSTGMAKVRRSSAFNAPPDSPLNTKSSTGGLGVPGDLMPGHGPGGVAGFRKREGSVGSVHSRPSSTASSKNNRAGSFFSNAKQLFAHTPSSDRQSAPPEDGPEDSLDLQLHMALSAGEISNIIIGDVGGDSGLDNLLANDTGRLEYAICGDTMASMEDALNMACAGEVTITKNAWKYVQADAYPGSEPRRNCYILKNIPKGLDATPPLRRVRNDRLLTTPVGSNPHYYKYINKSAIHRLILNPDNTFPAQFRNATILFISLGDVKPWTPEGLAFCQNAISIVYNVTSTYEGFIQQFAVDDKGATLLCAFGLPYPRSHEQEAIFAAKSAWVIQQEFLRNGIRGFRISLATGVIFTCTIGNEFRRDPAIVGDTIVIAVRILKFDYATDSVVCDEATMAACTSEHNELCVFEDRGEEFVKGKVHPLRIFRLIHFGAKKQTRRPNDVQLDDTIGYIPEREKVLQFTNAWAANPDKNTILVSGPRGSGKGMFYQLLIHNADDNQYQICSAASVEVEKNTEYYPCKFLLLGLFDIMRKPDVPFAPQPVIESPPKPEPLRPVAPMADGPEDELPTGEYIEEEPPVSNTTHIFSPALSLPEAAVDMPYVPDAPAAQALADSPQVENYARRRRSSAFSADMAQSPTISQYDTPSARTSTHFTKLEAFIKICLSKMGPYDPKLLPVLHDIISNISSDLSHPIVDPKDDALFTDFVVNVLNYASKFLKIIVMFEDMQWCDFKSLELVQAIHERCPAVLVVLFSRPLKDYGVTSHLKITNHPNHLDISLDGIKRREIEQALLRAFQANGVKTINPEVIELVQARTHGNPGSVRNMANMLKDFSHVNIVDGELLTTGQDLDVTDSTAKSMEDIVMKQDRKKTTLMQYDRLGPQFQDFLKIASCLDERFSLAEVAAIRPLETLLGPLDPGRSYARVISDLDTYKFLNLATEQQTNIQFSDNVVLQPILTFGSPSTARSIYDSIPYEERVGYHLRMGQFYESFLAKEFEDDPTAATMNCQDLLPQITRHYLKTDYTEKKLTYLKALAEFHLKSNMLTDTTQNIDEIINILENVRGARDLLSNADLADIYGMKGVSLAKRMRIQEAEPALLVSLQMYGITWPTTKRQWKSELMKKKLNFLFHYHRGALPIKSTGDGVTGMDKNQNISPFEIGTGVTGGIGLTGGSSSGSSREHSHSNSKLTKSKQDMKNRVRLERIVRVFSCLQNMYFWKTQPEAALLSSYYTLEFCKQLGVPCGDQTASLGRLGLLMYFQGKKRKCDAYMQSAERGDQAGETTEGMLPAMKAFVEYCEGRRAEAHRLLDVAINESKAFGVVNNLPSFYRAATTKCAFRMWEGALTNHPEDCQLLRTLSGVAIQNGDTEGEALFAIPTLTNLIFQDRYREAESWVVLVEKHIMPRATQTNLLLAHGMLSFYYAKTGNYPKSRIFIQLWSERIVDQGNGAHPFPLMSCLSIIMTCYEMLDSIPRQSRRESTVSTGTGSSAQVVPTIFTGSESSLSSTSTATSSVPLGQPLEQDPLQPMMLDRTLSLTIQYLKIEPFQAVATALAWLAEAARCFIAGKDREGSQKLAHGYRVVFTGIDGIDWVHAYYLTQLGRHSEGEMKEMYHRTAFHLFKVMSMDPAAWLSEPGTRQSVLEEPVLEGTILSIPEVFEHVLSYLRVRHLRRLRLVSKRVYDACRSSFNVAVLINPENVTSIHHIENVAPLIRRLCIKDLDEVPPSLESFIVQSSLLSTVEVCRWGLDIDFLHKILDISPKDLKRLSIQNEGFVDLEDIVGAVARSCQGPLIQSLSLHIDSVGLETHALGWSCFRSVLLDKCSSLTMLSLGYIKVDGVPEALEETNALHVTTTTFPNLKSLELIHCDITCVELERLLRLFPNLGSLYLCSAHPVFEPDEVESSDLVPMTTEEGGEGGGDAPVGNMSVLNPTTSPATVQTTNISLSLQPPPSQPVLCPRLYSFTYFLSNNKRNSRSQQHRLAAFLTSCRQLRDLELSGHFIKDEDILSLGEIWSRLGMELRKIVLSHQRAVTEAGIEMLLRMRCCRRLQVLDVMCSPELLQRFCQSTMTTTVLSKPSMVLELPCSATLVGLHLQKNESEDRLALGAMQCLNQSLKQLPRLVDLTIGVKLESLAVFDGLGRDYAKAEKKNVVSSGSNVEDGGDDDDNCLVNDGIDDGKKLGKEKDNERVLEAMIASDRDVVATIDMVATARGAVVDTARERLGAEWIDERPFLQSLAIGYSNEFYNREVANIPHQIGRRFRFLEDFRYV